VKEVKENSNTYTVTNQHAGMYSSPHLAKKPGPKASAASSGRLHNRIQYCNHT